MPRRRTYTEMIGYTLPKSEYELLKAEMKRRKLSVSEFLRRTAVAPLLAELAQQGHNDDSKAA
jgi:hypothetical protein